MPLLEGRPEEDAFEAEFEPDAAGDPGSLSIAMVTNQNSARTVGSGYGDGMRRLERASELRSPKFWTARMTEAASIYLVEVNLQVSNLSTPDISKQN